MDTSRKEISVAAAGLKATPVIWYLPSLLLILDSFHSRLEPLLNPLLQSNTSISANTSITALGVGAASKSLPENCLFSGKLT